MKHLFPPSSLNKHAVNSGDINMTSSLFKEEYAI